MAREFADQAKEVAYHFAGHPDTEAGRPWGLTADQGVLYRIAIHRHLGDIDTALATARRLRPAQLPTAECCVCGVIGGVCGFLGVGGVVGVFAWLGFVG
ncbi:transcriptional regulator, partial [Streptomyces buecherae]